MASILLTNINPTIASFKSHRCTGYYVLVTNTLSSLCWFLLFPCFLPAPLTQLQLQSHKQLQLLVNACRLRTSQTRIHFHSLRGHVVILRTIFVKIYWMYKQPHFINTNKKVPEPPDTAWLKGDNGVPVNPITTWTVPRPKSFVNIGFTQTAFIFKVNNLFKADITKVGL